MAAQVFTGQVPEYSVRVDHPHVLRTTDFRKEAADTRLRLTYRDKGRTGFSLQTFTATVMVSIDGVPVPLLDTVFDAPSAGTLGADELFRVSSPFTTVGYVTGLAAGPHTFSSSYRLEGASKPVVGYVTDSPYLIEIDEQP
jgi:hypothetical protein